MLALSPLVLQLIQLGIQVVPGLIAAALTEIELVNSDTPPSDVQREEIRAALEEANTALMNAQQST